MASIDIGTESSVMALFTQAKNNQSAGVEIIQNENGNQVTPSFISWEYKVGAKREIGATASKYKQKDASIRNMTRMLALKAGDEEQLERELNFCFLTQPKTEAGSPYFKFKVGKDKWMTMVEIFAGYLKKLVASLTIE